LALNFLILCRNGNWKAGSSRLQLLLDTHAFLWWLTGDDALSGAAKTAIADENNGIFVSAASAWEIATKHRIGKLSGGAAIVADLDQIILDQGFMELPISLRHGRVAGGLQGPHRDPFDRMLIAQAMLENLVLVSNERPFDVYGIGRLW
jgi:PIN domain nuclease of toxin-antitoxin system